MLLCLTPRVHFATARPCTNTASAAGTLRPSSLCSSHQDPSEEAKAARWLPVSHRLQRKHTPAWGTQPYSLLPAVCNTAVLSHKHGQSHAASHQAAAQRAHGSRTLVHFCDYWGSVRKNNQGHFLKIALELQFRGYRKYSGNASLAREQQREGLLPSPRRATAVRSGESPLPLSLPAARFCSHPVPGSHTSLLRHGGY